MKRITKYQKPEARISKYETISKPQNPNSQNCFEFLPFGLVSDFDIRISNLR